MFLAGRGDGTFAPGVSIPVGIDPVAVTSCDVLANDDWAQNGKCGLAVSDAGSHDIAVLTGNGDGTFKAPVFYPVDGAPGAIAAGTVVAGTPAIAFVEPASDRVGLLVSAGNGTFQPEVSIAVGHHPVAIDADELYASRQLMVVEEGDNDVRRIYVFAPPPPGLPPLADAGTMPVGASPRAIAPFGDGTVAVANHDSGTVTIFGGCGPAITLPAGPNPSALAWLRLTGPNDPTIAPHDLAVVNQGQHTLTLFTHQTDGWCGPPGPDSQGTYTASTLPVPVDASALVARPFDRIGLSDLALLNPAGQVSVMLDSTPTVAVYPQRVDFGQVTVGQSATVQVEVVDLSPIPTRLRQATLNIPARFGFSLQDDGCAWRTLATGQNCRITIRFTPVGSGGSLNQLLLEDDAADSQYMVPITGTGVDLTAAISSPRQSLAQALDHGMRAIVSCSAACRITVRAEYKLRNRVLNLGATHATITHKGRTRLRIWLHAARTPLAHATSGRIQLETMIITGHARPIHLRPTITLSRRT